MLKWFLLQLGRTSWGRTLVLDLGITAMTCFYDIIHIWPIDEERLKVVVFAVDEWNLQSFLTSYKVDVLDATGEEGGV